MSDIIPVDVKWLKSYIDSCYQSNKDIMDSSLIITTADSSIGARAGVKVNSVHVGFDWEAGQFRIEPAEPLVRSSLTRDTPKDIVKWKDGYFCPKCNGSLMKKEVKNSHYCSCCGQRLSSKIKEVSYD